MEAKTTLHKLEIEPATGRIFVRLLKEVTNGNAVIFSEPHRFVVEPQENQAHLSELTALFDAVNHHLEGMGFPAMSAENIETISAAAQAHAIKIAL
jgi:hypothetical protein